MRLQGHLVVDHDSGRQWLALGECFAMLGQLGKVFMGESDIEIAKCSLKMGHIGISNKFAGNTGLYGGTDAV
jgi:hypothetical protein